MRIAIPLVLSALALVACKKDATEGTTSEKKEDKAEKKEDKTEKKDEKTEKKDEKKDDEKAEKKADKGDEKCALSGKWSGTTPSGQTPVNGKPISVEFGEGTSEWNAGPMKNTGKWTLDGSNFSVDNVAKGGGPYSCKPGEPGKYKVTFDGCKKVTFKLDADACQGRTKVMDGLTLEKSS